jgi:hypothetical protein
LTDSATPSRPVLVWITEGTWRASVDASLRLAPPGAPITLLHVTPAELPEAAHGAYLGMLGRGQPSRDPGPRVAELGRRLGQRPARCRRAPPGPPVRPDPAPRSPRTGSGDRGGPRGPAHHGPRRRPGPSRPQEPGQNGPVRRRPRPVPDPAGMARNRPQYQHHPPAATRQERPRPTPPPVTSRAAARGLSRVYGRSTRGTREVQQTSGIWRRLLRQQAPAGDGERCGVLRCPARGTPSTQNTCRGLCRLLGLRRLALCPQGFQRVE